MGSFRAPDYLQKAAECLSLGTREGLTTEERQRWFDLAEYWKKLADGVEGPWFEHEFPDTQGTDFSNG